MEKSSAVEVLKGVGLVFGLHAAVLLGGFVVGGSAGLDLAIPLLLGLAVFGFTQLLWVGPAAVWVSKRGSDDMLKGVWIAAGLTVLLNGACFVFMLV